MQNPEKKNQVSIYSLSIIAIVSIMAIFLITVIFIHSSTYRHGYAINIPTDTISDSVIENPSDQATVNVALNVQAATDPPGTTDYYGAVMIDNNPAPAGTEIIASTQAVGFVCGSFTVRSTSPGEGQYGFLHCNCGGNDPGCRNEIINFTVNGIPAIVVGDTAWDESLKNVNLSIITRCSDGTLFNTCTGVPKMYCKQTGPNSGYVMTNCSLCGCPPPIYRKPKPPIEYYCDRSSGQCCTVGSVCAVAAVASIN
jgi:hypothetical protein